MALESGTRVGPYEIEAPIGAGGMGEVYRARDPRLGRTVALKLLPRELAADHDRVARFEREARAASALNHPHIVSVFDTGQVGDTPFIAMELVDGQPLTSWVARERPQLKRLLEVFTQVADALAAAHEAGIVHRDVKPANLLVTGQGYAKVLDFGLAKVDAPPSSPQGATVTGPVSRPGVVMGTTGYMSPEQAQGMPTDARTDVFSLGAVLYEAVTGRRPFDGANDLDVLHAIVHATPQPLAVRAPSVPPPLQWIADKALAKDRDQRYQSMKELAADLRRLRQWLDEPAAAVAGGMLAGRPARRWPFALGGALLSAAAVLALLVSPAVRSRLLQPTWTPRVGITLTPLTADVGYEGQPTFSPDGQTLAYVSNRAGNFEIFLRQVGGGPDLNLTNDPADDVQPEFSPDGRQIVFVSSRGGQPPRYPSPDSPLLGGDIWVMPALGGAPRRVATGNFPSWTPDGAEIVFTAGRWFGRRLYRVPAIGGVPQEIPIAIGASSSGGRPGMNPDLILPHVSPDGRMVAFSAMGAIFVAPARGGTPTRLARGSYPAWNPDSQALIYSSHDPGVNRSLWRLPFSTVEGRVTGPAEPLTIGPGADVEPVVSRDGRRIAFAVVSASANVEALPLDVATGRPAGEAQPLTTGTDEIYFFNLSPDDRTLAYTPRRGQIQGIWRADHGKAPVQLSLDPRYVDSYPRWSPDGRQIAFSRQPAGVADARSRIWLMDPDGGNPRPLAQGGTNGFFAWMPDSRTIVFQSPDDRQYHRFDIASGRTERLSDEPGLLPVVATSADGRWLVYQATDPERGNAVIRAMPATGGASRVVVASDGNSYHPSLSPSGRWLYFTPDHGNILRVPGPADAWRAAAPEPISAFPESGLFLEDPQVSPDGRWLVFSRRHLTADVWILDLDGQPPTAAASSR